MDEVKNSKIRSKPIKPASVKHNQNKDTSILSAILSVIRNIIALIIGFFMSIVACALIADTLPIGLIAFSATALLIMDNTPKAKLFKFIKNLTCIVMAAGFVLLFYQKALVAIYMEHYIIASLITGGISLVVAITTFVSLEKKPNNFKRMIVRLLFSVFYFVLVLSVYAFLFKFLHFDSFLVFMIITLVYAIIELDVVFSN